MTKSLVSTNFVFALVCCLLLVATHQSDGFSTNGIASARPPSRGLIESAFGQVYREINTSRQYADAVDRQLRPTVVAKDTKFEERLKKYMEGQSRPAVKKSIGPIQEVLTLEEYKKVVIEESDKMVVVRFHAPWCRACKATKPSFEKFAREHTDTIKFVECPINSVNTEVHRQLGIKTIPFAHVYHPSAGLVEQRKVSRQHYSTFEKLMKDYMKGECAVQDDEYASDPYPLVPKEMLEDA